MAICRFGSGFSHNKGVLTASTGVEFVTLKFLIARCQDSKRANVNWLHLVSRLAVSVAHWLTTVSWHAAAAREAQV